MTDRSRGLYEILITEAIASQLGTLGDGLHAIRSPVRPAKRRIGSRSISAGLFSAPSLAWMTPIGLPSELRSPES